MAVRIQKIGCIMAFVFFLFAHALPAHALVVSPAIKKIYVKPGEQVIETISISNETENKVTLSPVVENFKPKDATGAPEFLGDVDPNGAARWIQIPFEKAVLMPHERKDFLFKINIPQWAVPGGHYAALFWKTHEDAQSGVSSVSRVGSLFLFGVQGKITGTVEMGDVQVAKNKDGGTEGFSFTIKNKSNIHVTPRGSVEIYTFFGRRVATIPLNGEGKNVLAQSERVFFEQWKQPYVSWGKLRVRVRGEFDYDFSAAEHEVEFYNYPKFAGLKILFVVVSAVFVAGWVYKKKRLKKEHKLMLGQ